MKKIFGVLAFAVGAAGGFFAGKFFYQEKYRKITENEIVALKKYYKIKSEAKPKPEEPLTTEEPPPSKEASPKPPEPAAFKGYWKGVDAYMKETELAKPFLIDPDEVGGLSGYEVVELTYYSDGILADERDNIMGKEDIEKSVGLDAIDHLALEGEEHIGVRNTRYKIDYEITLDKRSYVEVVGETPKTLEK